MLFRTVARTFAADSREPILLEHSVPYGGTIFVVCSFFIIIEICGAKLKSDKVVCINTLLSTALIARCPGLPCWAVTRSMNCADCLKMTFRQAILYSVGGDGNQFVAMVERMTYNRT